MNHFYQSLAFVRRASFAGIALVMTSLGVSDVVHAQIKVSPIQRTPPSSAATPIAPKAGRTKAVTLTLPFFDDFSFTPVDDPKNPKSNYPLESLWMNSSSTWITSATGINLPTINAAVFDGLDSAGRSYSDQVLANGFRDVLTSQLIDLGPSEVGAGEREFVYLSFYYQWTGNGDAPEENDFLRLEFLAQDSVWTEMLTILPTEDIVPDQFYYTMVRLAQVGDYKFFHNEFQFRFRSFGGQHGPVDTWIVDHIYLDKNRTENTYPNDKAMASVLTPLFGRYYAIPLISSKLQDEIFHNVQFDVQNLGADPETRPYTFKATLRRYKGNTLLGTTNKDLAYKAPLPGGPLDEFERERIETTVTLSPDDVDVSDTTRYEIDYNIYLDPDDLTGEDVLFRDNDTINARYYLDNYYAYDDGSAEYSIQLTQPGNRILYEFDIDTTQERRFAGFDIFVPAFTVADNLRIDFYIHGYDEATDGPGEVLYAMPSKVIERTALNKFQRFTIPEGEELQVNIKDKIYIGWAAPNVGKFDVGLDRSNNTVDKVFTRTSGDWVHTDVFQGSIMIRPLFGSGVRVPTGVEQDLVNVPLYPNPSKGEFFVDERTEVTSIINIAGQAIPFASEFTNNQRRVTTSANPGLYLVKMKKGTKLFVRKLIVE